MQAEANPWYCMYRYFVESYMLDDMWCGQSVNVGYVGLLDKVHESGIAAVGSRGNVYYTLDTEFNMIESKGFEVCEKVDMGGVVYVEGILAERKIGIGFSYVVDYGRIWYGVVLWLMLVMSVL